MEPPFDLQPEALTASGCFIFKWNHRITDAPGSAYGHLCILLYIFSEKPTGL
jgi:hypothetical protein